MKPPPGIFCEHNQGTEHLNSLLILQQIVPLKPNNNNSIDEERYLSN